MQIKNLICTFSLLCVFNLTKLFEFKKSKKFYISDFSKNVHIKIYIIKIKKKKVHSTILTFCLNLQGFLKDLYWKFFKIIIISKREC